MFEVHQDFIIKNNILLIFTYTTRSQYISQHPSFSSFFLRSSISFIFTFSYCWDCWGTDFGGYPRFGSASEIFLLVGIDPPLFSRIIETNSWKISSTLVAKRADVYWKGTPRLLPKYNKHYSIKFHLFLKLVSSPLNLIYFRRCTFWSSSQRTYQFLRANSSRYQMMSDQ